MTELGTRQADTPAAAGAGMPAPAGADRYRPMVAEGDGGHDRYGLPIDSAYVPRFGPEAAEQPGLTAFRQDVFDHSTPLRYGRSFLPHDDLMLDGETRTAVATARMEPEEGLYAIVGHGDGSHIEVATPDGGKSLMSAADFAPLLRMDPDWRSGDGIVLVSCDNGNQFMRDLYEEFDGQVTIKGSKTLVKIVSDGTYEPCVQNGLDANGNPILDPVPDGWETLHARPADGPDTDP